jgi:hypothetical protein
LKSLANSPGDILRLHAGRAPQRDAARRLALETVNSLILRKK